jgi:hypothetical protein
MADVDRTTQLMRDLYWTAGFIEGEGSFVWRHTPDVVASQVQKEPLERLYALFGGNLNVRESRPTANGYIAKPIWMWSRSGGFGAGLMMTLFPLMSPKRQEQIKRVLAIWRQQPGPRKHRGMCKNGHFFSEENTYRYTTANGSNHRKCIACNNMRSSRRYRARKKEN